MDMRIESAVCSVQWKLRVAHDECNEAMELE